MSAIKIGLVSLGCSKNLVDTEVMIANLKENGYDIVSDPSEADCIIVNTCGFIEDAKEESIGAILEMSVYEARLIVSGCLAQRYADQIMTQMLEIDAIIGTDQIEEISLVVESVMNNQKLNLTQRSNNAAKGAARILSTPPYFAYLKIADGCDNNCSYCAIPAIRGPYKSRTIEDITEEARALVQSGVRELSVIAQDITYYGMDIYNKVMLCELLGQLCQIEPLKWIRLHYCYPERITSELIDIVAKSEKIVKYLDIPLQHCEESILKNMGRRGNRKNLEVLLETLRKNIPDIAIRTSLITGFPGESPDHFNALMEFISKQRFEHLGVFAFSKEEGTGACKLREQVPKRTRESRRNKLMKLQQKIVFERNKTRIGQVQTVLVEGVDEYGIYNGRNSKNAYEIDTMVLFTSQKDLSAGQFVNVKITAADGYELIGECI